MNEKPADFFLGVRELFAILVPGAAALALVASVDWPPLPFDIPRVIRGAGAWIAWAAGAYLVGHVLAGAGELLLDPQYERLIQTEKVIRASTIRHGGSKPSGLRSPSGLWWFVFRRRGSKDRDGFLAAALLERAEAAATEQFRDVIPTLVRWGWESTPSVRDADREFPRPDEERAVDTLDWAWSLVNIRSAAAMREIERLHSESKLFRSLALLSLVLILWGWHRIDTPVLSLWQIVGTSIGVLGVGLFLTWLCWQRFIALRTEGNKRIAEYYLALYELPRAHGGAEPLDA